VDQANRVDQVDQEVMLRLEMTEIMVEVLDHLEWIRFILIAN
jgi:hypothetical protein